MTHLDPDSPITEEHVRMLAGLAALPLDPTRLPALTRAFGADLRMIRALRDIDAGAIFPLTATTAREDRAHGS